MDEFEPLKTVPQWSKEEAEQMSKEKFRENYLEISKFGYVENEQIVEFSETIEEELVEEFVEEFVEEESTLVTYSYNTKSNPIPKSKTALIYKTIAHEHFLTFEYEGLPQLVKPFNVNGMKLECFCFIKNENQIFKINKIDSIKVRTKPYTLEVDVSEFEHEYVSNIVNTCIAYNKYIKIHYLKSGYEFRHLDEDKSVNLRSSIRTISKIKLALDVLPLNEILKYKIHEGHISAYCHYRAENKTFKIDRIQNISILNI